MIQITTVRLDEGFLTIKCFFKIILMILTSTSDCVYSTELNQLYCKAISNHSGE